MLIIAILCAICMIWWGLKDCLYFIIIETIMISKLHIKPIHSIMIITRYNPW